MRAVAFYFYPSVYRHNIISHYKDEFGSGMVGTLKPKKPGFLMQRWKLNWSKTQCFSVSCFCFIPVWLQYIYSQKWLGHGSLFKEDSICVKNDQGNAWLSITSCGRAVALGNPGSEGQALQKYCKWNWNRYTLGRDSLLGVISFGFWKRFGVFRILKRIHHRPHPIQAWNSGRSVFSPGTPFHTRWAPDPVSNCGEITLLIRLISPHLKLDPGLAL